MGKVWLSVQGCELVSEVELQDRKQHCFQVLISNNAMKSTSHALSLMASTAISRTGSCLQEELPVFFF
jgi:hypothetical protein